jgi:hypothetical protein
MSMCTEIHACEDFMSLRNKVLAPKRLAGDGTKTRKTGHQKQVAVQDRATADLQKEITQQAERHREEMDKLSSFIGEQSRLLETLTSTLQKAQRVSPEGKRYTYLSEFEVPKPPSPPLVPEQVPEPKYAGPLPFSMKDKGKQREPESESGSVVDWTEGPEVSEQSGITWVFYSAQDLQDTLDGAPRDDSGAISDTRPCLLRPDPSGTGFWVSAQYVHPVASAEVVTLQNSEITLATKKRPPPIPDRPSSPKVGQASSSKKKIIDPPKGAANNPLKVEGLPGGKAKKEDAPPAQLADSVMAALRRHFGLNDPLPPDEFFLLDKNERKEVQARTVVPKWALTSVRNDVRNLSLIISGALTQQNAVPGPKREPEAKPVGGAGAEWRLLKDRFKGVSLLKSPKSKREKSLKEAFDVLSKKYPGDPSLPKPRDNPQRERNSSRGSSRSGSPTPAPDMGRMMDLMMFNMMRQSMSPGPSRSRRGSR